jgi:hypothetical protein
MTPLIYLIHWLVERFLGRETAQEMKQAALKGF